MSTGTQVEVVMPQMGVSVAEGTVTRWLKQPGDTVERDETLLEISTDKVDTEVPSPGAGVVAEIRVQEGETVEVGTVLAVIAPEGAAPRGGAAERGARAGGARSAERTCRLPSRAEPPPPLGAPRRSPPAPAAAAPSGQRQDVRLPRRRPHRRRARRRPGWRPGHRARAAA